MDRKNMVKMAATLRKITLRIENAQAAKQTRQASRIRKAGSMFNAEVAEFNAKQIFALINRKKELDAELDEVSKGMGPRKDALAAQTKDLRDEFHRNFDPVGDKLLELHSALLGYAARERKNPAGFEIAWDRVEARKVAAIGGEVITGLAQIMADMDESLRTTQSLMTDLEVLAVASETGSNRTAGLLSSLVEAFNKLKPRIDKALSVFGLAKKRINDNNASIKSNLTKLMDMQDEAIKALEV